MQLASVLAHLASENKRLHVLAQQESLRYLSQTAEWQSFQSLGMSHFVQNMIDLII